MHTPPLTDYLACIHHGDWDGVGAIMLESARRLAAAGADFLICPDNTIHQALTPALQARSPRPWLHIAEVVADVAEARGYQKPGLTGTRWLVDSAVYPTALQARGLDFARLPEEDRDTMNRLIMDELVPGSFHPATVLWFQEAIGRLQSAGCDAVVLGCTEIPLIIGEHNSPLPVLDSTRLLARAALRRALGPIRLDERMTMPGRL